MQVVSVALRFPVLVRSPYYEECSTSLLSDSLLVL